jgi:acetylornithine/succinyldiaminopimelate/putrescine aminotransferase
MVGIELDLEGATVVQQCLDQKLLINCTQGNVIRLLPAMNLSDEQAERGCEILCGVLESLQVGSSSGSE